MDKENSDLHGNAPDSCAVAILIIDMINDLEFPEGPQLLEPAIQAAGCIAELKEQAKRLHIPVIYVNDNFGHWRSDLSHLVQHCLQRNLRGQPIVKLLQPEPGDYVVLKPKHSAFYETPLALLLSHLGAKRLIMTGLSTNVCIQFSAQDAYLRDFQLSIPSNCVVAPTLERTQSGLSYMQHILQADTTPTTELDLERFL